MPAVPDPAVPPFDAGAVEPPVVPATEPAPPEVGAVPELAAPEPPAGGLAVELLPAVGVEPAEFPGADGVLAMEPLAPVALVSESLGALEQAARHSESNAEGMSIRRAKVAWLDIDILLSSLGIEIPMSPESGAVRCGERRNTISIGSP